jgi:menaquinone-dependent protoporphyrinogen oxidase
MCEVPVFYASSHGQTRRIAERLSALIRDDGFTSTPIDLQSGDAANFDWRAVRGAVVGAPLYAGRHLRCTRRFVARHHNALNGVPSAFFSVSLSAGSKNAAEAATARRLADALPQSALWWPNHVACFAGRLAYTAYNPVIRFLMRRIARREGGPTDTTRDHELTDWKAVAALADTIVAAIRKRELHDERRAG